MILTDWLHAALTLHLSRHPGTHCTVVQLVRTAGLHTAEPLTPANQSVI
jgi:hypothetical protein